MSLASNYMPWEELIKAFNDNLPKRLKLEEASLMADRPKTALREFRLLTIGGQRQCGKTIAGFETVRKNPNARLIGTRTDGFPSLPQNDTVVRSRILMTKDIDQKSLEGVKLVVIDTDGYQHPFDDPYTELVALYSQHRDWFDPEFSIIRIL